MSGASRADASWRGVADGRPRKRSQVHGGRNARKYAGEPVRCVAVDGHDVVTQTVDDVGSACGDRCQVAAERTGISHIVLKDRIRTSSRVTSVGRVGFDKVKTKFAHLDEAAPGFLRSG